MLCRRRRLRRVAFRRMRRAERDQPRLRRAVEYLGRWRRPRACGSARHRGLRALGSNVQVTVGADEAIAAPAKDRICGRLDRKASRTRKPRSGPISGTPVQWRLADDGKPDQRGRRPVSLTLSARRRLATSGPPPGGTANNRSGRPTLSSPQRLHNARSWEERRWS